MISTHHLVLPYEHSSMLHTKPVFSLHGKGVVVLQIHGSCVAWPAYRTLWTEYFLCSGVFKAICIRVIHSSSALFFPALILVYGLGYHGSPRWTWSLNEFVVDLKTVVRGTSGFFNQALLFIMCSNFECEFRTWNILNPGILTLSS